MLPSGNEVYLFRWGTFRPEEIYGHTSFLYFLLFILYLYQFIIYPSHYIYHHFGSTEYIYRYFNVYFRYIHNCNINIRLIVKNIMLNMETTQVHFCPYSIIPKRMRIIVYFKTIIGVRRVTSQAQRIFLSATLQFKYIYI